MKVAYVGDYINHGKSLEATGASMVILLSLSEKIEFIDIFCPEQNQKFEKLELPQRVKLHEYYRYDDSISILRLLKIHWDYYDIVIFNMLPTGYGNQTIPNALALIVPIILRIILKQSNIKVIYQNSIFTNDIRSLGYNSAFDKIRAFFLRIIERTLFKNVDTYMFLDLYKQRIDNCIGKNKVNVLNGRYLEAIPTLYLNKVLNAEFIDTTETCIPTILLHGFWGPQKNIELGLTVLRKLRKEGKKFIVIISGGINYHFPQYRMKFQELLCSNSDIIDKYLGPASQNDIMKVFLNADLLLLPYNAPGGHSAVLEQAIFFEIPTIAIDFPEFREQTKGVDFVKLIKSEDDLLLTIDGILHNKTIRKNRVSVMEKIQQAVNNLEKLID